MSREVAMSGSAVQGRMTAEAPPGTVALLIGVRVNRPWKIRRWLPVFIAMPRMLVELRRHPELGLLGFRTYVGGLTVLVVQYWRSAQDLDAYASSRDHEHLPAWRQFNRRIRDNGDVGIFHETYIADRYETIYVNMPADFGLGGATSLVSPARRGQRAAHRLDPAVPDSPVVGAY
jgi:Domain of unknown function (DUF4188)